VESGSTHRAKEKRRKKKSWGREGDGSFILLYGASGLQTSTSEGKRGQRLANEQTRQTWPTNLSNIEMPVCNVPCNVENTVPFELMKSIMSR
jgi:hypothetical protein